MVLYISVTIRKSIWKSHILLHACDRRIQLYFDKMDQGYINEEKAKEELELYFKAI